MIEFLLIIGFILFIIIAGTHELIFWDSKESWLRIPFRKKIKYKEALDSNASIYSWTCSNTNLKDYPTITFSQFKDFYYVNPSSWELYEYFVRKDRNRNLIMIFEYPEWKEYNKFRKQLEKDKKAAAENKKKQEAVQYKNEVTKKILESVQRDIDAIRAENQKAFDEAARLIKKAEW